MMPTTAVPDVANANDQTYGCHDREAWDRANQAVVSELSHRVDSQRIKIEALQDENTALAAEKVGLRDQLSVYKRSSDRFELDVIGLKREVAELKQRTGSKLSALEAENSDLRGKVSALEAENSELRGKVSALEAENSELRSKVSALEAENSELRGKVSALEAESSELRGKVSALEAESSELRGKVSGIEEQMSEILRTLNIR